MSLQHHRARQERSFIETLYICDFQNSAVLLGDWVYTENQEKVVLMLVLRHQFALDFTSWTFYMIFHMKQTGTFFI